jgi:hypothetical protein
MNMLVAKEVARVNQAQVHQFRLMESSLKNLEDKNRLLESANVRLDGQVRALQKASESIPVNFLDDWKLVFDFFIRNTKFANPPKVGGILEDAVLKNAADLQKLSSDFAQGNLNTSPGPPSLAGTLRGTASSSSSGAQPPSGVLASILVQLDGLEARLDSKGVTIGNYTFRTLTDTTKWATANLPSAPDKSLLCVDVVSLLHSIGREFATTEETRDTVYQNKRAGVSTMAITLSSSFASTLPQIMGRSSKSSGEDSGLALPCASTYKEWSDNSVGIATGIKPRILEGLETQKAVYEEAIRELAYTHAAGAAMTSQLLQRSMDFATALLGMIDTMWNEYSSRSTEIQPSEAWQIICAVVRQLFREFRNVRRPGAGVVPGSTSSIGVTWWYVLQTHRIMDEFTAVNIRRHHSIIPVFTSHLDQHRVTKSTHHALASQVKRIDTLLTTVNATVNRLNGARGNNGGRGGAAGRGGRGAGEDQE